MEIKEKQLDRKIFTRYNGFEAERTTPRSSCFELRKKEVNNEGRDL
ncbi:MAG: hypothetical protein WCE90_12605 [Candidatus Zixiibacteriota bacterium]